MELGKENIDNNFLNLLQDKIERFKKNVPDIYKTSITVDTLLDAGRYIDVLKPKSKYRKYKTQILEFLDVLENNYELSKRDIVELQSNYLSDLVIFLISGHGFQEKHGTFWKGVFSLGLDVILILTGLAKIYYYIPIFTIFTVLRGRLKTQKAKREKKYLDF